MYNKNLIFFLLIGIFSITLINASYNTKPSNQSKIKESDIKTFKAHIMTNGNLIIKGEEKMRLVDISEYYFVEKEGDFVLTTEVKANIDLYNDLYDFQELRKGETPEWEDLRFIRIHTNPHITLFKSVGNAFKSDFKNNFDLFRYELKDGRIKYKIQNKTPFYIKNKKILEFKSYQIELKNESVRNTEITFDVDGKKYRLLTKAIYSI